MKNIIFAGAAVALLAVGSIGTASATPLCPGNHNTCTTGSGGIDNSVTNKGGNGGNAASKAKASVRNTVTNTNKVRVNATAKQKQQQGQIQGQKQTISNSGNSKNKNTAKGGDSSGQQTTFTDNSTYEAAASSAQAAALAASAGACMGSTSAGVQGMSLGVSVGTTWTDDDCVRMRYGAAFVAMQKPEVAVALYCQNADVAAAMKTAGTECKADVAKRDAAKTEAASTGSWGPATTDANYDNDYEMGGD